MTTNTVSQLKKSVASPDDLRTFEKGQMALVHMGGVTFGHAVFQPGWKWSECVKPIAKTELCEVRHVGYLISGRMKVVMADGTEAECGPGDVVEIPAGHDAWIVGDEPCVYLEISNAESYAKR